MAGWHDNVFFGVHYDFHANEKDDAIGSELTPGHLRDRLLRVRPDWVHCDCKGHKGYTSWPTKIGSTAPGLVKDQLAIHRDVTRELGIKLGVHYSGVWDVRAIELHPEWARVNEAGEQDRKITCRSSGYTADLMIPQLIELIDKYDVDGFWVDGENWASLPCWCEACMERFRVDTGLRDVPRGRTEAGWGQWLAFHRKLFIEHVQAWTTAVKQRKPSAQVCSSYIYGARQPDREMLASVDYLSGDLDFRWGAEHAALEGRVFDARGRGWDLMAWMFTKPGPMSDTRPWLHKPLVHLCQEVSEALALGGSVMVYEQPQRTGWLVGWHNEIIAQLAEFCRARKDVCWKTFTVPQVGVLEAEGHFYRNNEILYQYEPATEPIEGALHATLQTGRSVDVLTEDVAERRLAEYPLLIIPEQTGLSAAWFDRLERYVRGGCHLVISGAHLSTECPQLVGALPQGGAIAGTSWFKAGDQAVGVEGPWQPVAPVGDTQVLAYRLENQEPDKDVTDAAMITRRRLGTGTVTALHGPAFAAFSRFPHPLLRKWIARFTQPAGVPWSAVAAGSSRIELVLRRRGESLLVNLINRGPMVVLPPKRILIDELPPVEHVSVTIRIARKPRRVACLPSAQPLEWDFEDGVLTVRVRRVDIHEVIVVE